MGSAPVQAPLVVIVGETASGKSALAMELASAFGGEIICADSRTVYKGADIGTAKPSIEERTKVTHHLLDVVRPDELFTAADFKRLALETTRDISDRGKLPIMVGGSGLYVDSVLYDYQFSQPGAERDERNPRHLKKVSETSRHTLRPNTLIIGLQVDREVLERRIVHRVEGMFDMGLLQEVRSLADKYGWLSPGLQAIGYKELKPVLGSEQSIEDATQLMIRNTKAYAKRQRTWFKRNKSIHWISDPAKAKSLVQNFLSNHPVTS